MAGHCFTYGSLMWADIMERVTGRALVGEPAVLADHARHPVRGQDYPGLRPAPGREVPGRLYRDLGAAEWQRLDAFEGPDYERVQVSLTLADGRPETAWVYRFKAEQAAQLEAGDWDPQAFEQGGRERFIARYVGFDQVDAASDS